MTESWRRLAVAVALNLTVGVGAARAQTVILKSAQPGAGVNVVFNTASVGTATTDTGGGATLDLTRAPRLEKVDTDVHIYVDACAKQVTVILLERGLQPEAPTGSECTRQEIAGYFAFRRGTTLLVDATGAAPMVWLRQGQVPSQWLQQGEAGRPLSKEAPLVPNGLALFGGGGFDKYENFESKACGDIAECTAKSFRGAYTGGVTYWINNYVGIDAAYMRSMRLTANAPGSVYNFDSFLDAHVVAVTGKVGYPYGPARFYVRGGAAYQRSTFSTTQTISTSTITYTQTVTNPDGTTTDVPTTLTVPAGTITNGVKTDGWGWLIGGGVEVWVNTRAGGFLEGGRLKLKGKAIDNSEATLNESAWFLVAGVRLHIGKGLLNTQ